MKTKLLKIVRKRYTIDKVSSYSNVANSTWKEYCDSIGMPFYYVKDLGDSFGFRNVGFKKYNDALSYLVRLIHHEHIGTKKRITKPIEEKVWYK